MEPKELRELDEKFLNSLVITTVLKETITPIKKLEELAGLSDLTLTGAKLENDTFSVHYEVTASRKVYSSLIRLLIKNRISGPENISEMAKGRDDKLSTKVIRIGYSNESILLFLRVYSPYNPHH